MIVKTYLSVLFGLWILTQTALVQAESDLLIAVDSVYSRGHYEQVELLVQRASPGLDSLSRDEQAAIYLKAGFAMIMRERESDARAYFTRALDAVPTLSLDPVRISPKFRSVFDDVKAAYRPQRIGDRPGDLSNIGRQSRNPRTAMANLLIPGSGHWLEGRRVRGITTTSIQLITIGLLVMQMDQMRATRDRYLEMSDQSRIEDAYNDYRREFRLAWLAGTFMGAVYLGSQMDFAWSSPPEPTPNRVSASWGWIPARGGACCQFTLYW